MSPTSNGEVSEAELMTITAADFPSPAELMSQLEEKGAGNIA